MYVDNIVLNVLNEYFMDNVLMNLLSDAWTNYICTLY